MIVGFRPSGLHMFIGDRSVSVCAHLATLGTYAAWIGNIRNRNKCRRPLFFLAIRKKHGTLMFSLTTHISDDRPSSDESIGVVFVLRSIDPIEKMGFF